WAPKLHSYYQERLGRLYEHPEFKHLRRNFQTSVFPAAAFNFGPQVQTIRHRDSMNCPFGWCSIQALGKFDPSKGGHLVLDDLRLVVEFPPHSVAFIPSATLTHANVPVQEGETRLSFTQYCPGGLLRFVDNGFMTEQALHQKDRKRYRKAMELKATRWKNGLELYTRIADDPRLYM
ncbi:hypothetical protein P691DRAFT_670464, partial [Macrolepiota fuliginosa MF-IS2]